MSVLANIVLTTANSTVFLSNAVGVAVEDVFISDTVLRNRNIRVLTANTITNAVTLTANVTVTEGDEVTFQHLLSGTGITESNSRVSYFLGVSQSYAPDIDPRLPIHVTNTEDFGPADTSLVLSSLSSVANVTSVTTASASRANTEIVVTDVTGVEVNDYVLTGNVRVATNVRVKSIDQANSTIKMTGQIRSNTGQTVYFQRAKKPVLRIGSEVIYYSNVDINTSSVTGITRNLANTRPSSTWIWAAGNVVSILGSASL